MEPSNLTVEEQEELSHLLFNLYNDLPFSSSDAERMQFLEMKELDI